MGELDFVTKDVDWSARMPKELIMESTIYKQGEAAGELKGELKGKREGKREVLALFLNRRLRDDAPRFVALLEASSEAQLEQLADLLSGTEPPEALIPLLEQLFSA